jgi:flagellar hook-associated protein 1
MSLQGALSIATSGLTSINVQLALLSHNVANASTPGYAVESSAQHNITAGDAGMGVVSGPATLAVDTQLQSDLLGQNATVAGLQTTQSALSAIDQVGGTPGQGQDLASLLGQLQSQFSTLLNDPADPTQQIQVVATATRLAQGINALSNAYTTQRQAAQNNIVAEVTTLNSTLGTIGSLSDQIISAQARGQSTADLQNQRNAAVTTLSQLVDVNVLTQPSGDLLITTDDGSTLPIHGTANPIATSGANVQPGSFYPGGGIPPITLNGSDITSALAGGQIGANLTLRDTTLPTDQAELDEFSQNLASRFDAQGLPLFTDPNGAVPAGGGMPVQTGYVGFASNIQVNAAVQADPSTARDGIPSANASGTAGFNTIIRNILDYGLGADASAGAPQPASNTTGLGPTGTLNAPYVAPATLSGIAQAMVGAQSQDSANATSQLASEQTVQTTLQTKLTSETGVSIDSEMSDMIQLQNAYGANAKVIAAVQSMWAQLIGELP